MSQLTKCGEESYILYANAAAVNDKVAKSSFWKRARGPHPIGNFGEVAFNPTSPKLPMR